MLWRAYGKVPSPGYIVPDGKDWYIQPLLFVRCTTEHAIDSLIQSLEDLRKIVRGDKTVDAIIEIRNARLTRDRETQTIYEVDEGRDPS